MHRDLKAGNVFLRLGRRAIEVSLQVSTASVLQISTVLYRPQRVGIR